jgi:hypothetical protein
LRKEDKHKELYNRRSTIQVFEKEGFSYVWQRRRLEQNEIDDDDDGNIEINSKMSIRCPFNITTTTTTTTNNNNNNNNNI